MRILFLAANPITMTALDLEEKLRSLENELRGVKYRDQVKLFAGHAVRPDDLIRHLRDLKPNVIHFSGHGSNAGISLRDECGEEHLVEGAQRIAVYAAVSREGCLFGRWTFPGDGGIDRNSFYRTLGDGLSVREAFRDGIDAIELHGGVDVFHCDGELELVLASRE